MTIKSEIKVRYELEEDKQRKIKRHFIAAKMGRYGSCINAFA